MPADWSSGLLRHRFGLHQLDFASSWRCSAPFRTSDAAPASTEVSANQPWPDVNEPSSDAGMSNSAPGPQRDDRHAQDQSPWRLFTCARKHDMGIGEVLQPTCLYVAVSTMTLPQDS